MTTAVQGLMLDLSGQLFLNGSYLKSLGASHDIYDPATGLVVGSYCDATQGEIEIGRAHV